MISFGLGQDIFTRTLIIQNHYFAPSAVKFPLYLIIFWDDFQVTIII